MPFRLTTLGHLVLADADTGQRLPVQRKALVLLAVLGAERRPVPRERLTLLLWPEGGEPARGALKQTVYQLRRTVGTDDVIVGASELEVNHDIVTTDVADVERAVAAQDWERVASLYGGPFLDGVGLRGSVDFEHWADGRRRRFAELFQQALEGLAGAAAARGDGRGAVAWWRRLAAEDPLSGRIALGLVTALAQTGDFAAALAHYATFESSIREELGTGPDPALVSAVEKIRASAATTRSLPARQAGSGTPARDVGRPSGGTAAVPVPQRPLPIPARARRFWPLPVLAALAVLAFAWRSTSTSRVIASLELPDRASARLALDPVLNRIYVEGGASFEHALAVIDGESLKARTVAHGAGALVDPITHWYWAGDYGERFVLVRNGFTDSTLARIAVPGCPHAMAINDGWLWVAQQCDDHISIIDNRTRRVVRHIPIPTMSRREVGGAKGMGEIVINPNTRMVYFWKDMIPHRLDPRTWTIAETPEFGGHVMAVNPATNKLYVRVFHGLRVVDGTTEQNVGEIRLPAPPWSVTVGVEGARVYAALPRQIMILDGRSHEVIETITFRDGYLPHGVVVDETRRRAYVLGTESTGRRSLKVVALVD